MYKYQFVAQYEDGSIYHQNLMDQSIKDETKSCFYDLDLEKIKVFMLLGPNHGIFGVDLSTGLFKANNAGEFYLGNDEIVGVRRLVYYRTVKKELNISDGSIIMESMTYHLGWSGINTEGREVQYTINIV